MSSSRLSELRKRLRAEISSESASSKGVSVGYSEKVNACSPLANESNTKSNEVQEVSLRSTTKVTSDVANPLGQIPIQGESDSLQVKFCEQCGKKLSDWADKFCSACGASIAQTSGARTNSRLPKALRMKGLRRVYGEQADDLEDHSDPGIPRLPPRPHCKALCIGMSSYEYVTQLTHCRKDAYDLSKTLDLLGYQVTTLLDQSYEQTTLAIDEFISEVNPGDELVFTFSGHGAGINTVPHLVAIDDDGSGDQLMDIYKYFIDPARTAQAKSAVVIIDACRNEIKVDVIDDREHLGLQNRQFGFAILYGSSIGVVSYDSLFEQGIKNGYFTYFLKDEICRPGQPLHETFRKTRKKVMELTSALESRGDAGLQVPSFYDDLRGDFYFYPVDR
jgi:ribosomal protein L37E